MEFEWDSGKAAKNLLKHGVSFAEAATVLGDPLGITVPDPDHSLDEERWFTFWQSRNRCMLIVAHAERGNRIRIISAREMSRSERKSYEGEVRRRHG